MPQRCLICKQTFTPKNTARVRKYCSPKCYHESTVIPLAQRLWNKVIKTDGCWLFMGRRNEHGYGRLNILQGYAGFDGPQIYAHRLSWQLHYGNIPPGKYLCHRCDVPNCVNPSHLYVGTPADNMRDKSERGRLPTGDRHWYYQKPRAGFRHPLTGRFQKV